MQIRHLRYFITVAEELHFGRAAKRLNMTQPPLSQQIQQLEGYLGVKLFYRTKRHVELTHAGSVFLVEAKQILHDIKNATDIARKADRGNIGQLKIGYTSTSIYEILPNILKIYYKEYPLIDVELQLLNTTEQSQAFYDNKIQIGLLCPPIENPHLNLKAIYKEPLIIALPSKHPLAISPLPIHIGDLADDSFIITSREAGIGFYDSIINICYQSGFSPNVIQEVNDLHTAITLVSTGLGVTLVPSSLKQYKKSNVVYRTLEKKKPIISTHIAWNSNERSDIVNNFVKLALDNFPSSSINTGV